MIDTIVNEHGQVFCQVCKQEYSVPELKLTHEIRGSWGYERYHCPAMHSIALIKDMHLFRKRN